MEKKIWASGISTWEDAKALLKNSVAGTIPARTKLDLHVPGSLRALEQGDAAFFARLAQFGETWRCYGEFSDRCVFLDIETTGLRPNYDEVTVVGTYDGKDYRSFVKGRNMSALSKELRKHAIVITFNGSGFDLPFLKPKFAAALPEVHIDLRWASYKLGYRGGLKEIEPKFGVRRPKRLSGMDGFDAVVLWDQYRAGNVGALERLIDYNRADVVGLKTIMEQCYDRLLAERTRALPRRRARSAHA
jgi:uncharacterized protein YprB with RNaseH-like and TPR domain